jgi:hypothetical protein
MQIKLQYQAGKMQRILLALVFFAACLLPLLLMGQQDEPPVDNDPPGIKISRQGTTDSQDDTAGPGQTGTQAKPVKGRPSKPVKEFKPTDKIDADSAVSFPVDI